MIRLVNRTTWLLIVVVIGQIALSFHLASRPYHLRTLSLWSSSSSAPNRKMRIKKTVLSSPITSTFGGEEELNDQFSDWASDEIAAQQNLKEQEMRDLAEDGVTGNELPKYMLDMIEANERAIEREGGVVASKPVLAGKLPTIAVVGRPNTGKSTIVNKLTNSYKDGAIVHDEPGITRDRTYRLGDWLDYNFQVVDTGGIVFDDTEDEFAERITQQALTAVEEATVVIMVCDGQTGITQMDYTLAKWLRRYNKAPLYLAVNKCESQKLGIAQAQEFWSLGLGEPFPVSGIHGTGIGDMLDQITEKHMEKITQVEKEVRLAVTLIYKYHHHRII